MPVTFDRWTSVAILGGGVGGLSAAHELAERGFDVTVYEWRDTFGGKARSIPVPGSGVGGRADLPGEHGFRFFPGFYWHVIDTMQRIPYRGGNVANHLVDATRILMAQAGGRNELIAPAKLPSSLNDARRARSVHVGLRHSAADSGLGARVSVPATAGTAHFVRRAPLRAVGEIELVGVHRRRRANREQFQKFLADGMTRTLVAAQAKKMSARTGGLIVTQIMLDMVKVNGRVDRVLDGPTSEVWIDPWIARLSALGVDVPAGCQVTEIHCDGRHDHRCGDQRRSSRSSRPTTTSRRCPSRSCAR